MGPLGQVKLACLMVVGTTTRQLLVFHAESLIWAAALPCVPAAIDVVSRAGVDGCLVLMSDNDVRIGALEVPS